MRSRWICGVFLISSAFCAPNASVGENREVRIGVIISQTGPLAQIGKGIVNAIVLADEQKDSDKRVKFIFEDDSLQPAKAITAAEKLISEDQVSAIITFAGGSSSALAPIAEKRHIPLFTIAAGDQHTLNRLFVYRLFLSTKEQAHLLKTQMLDEGLSKIAIVTTVQESLVRLRDLLKDELGKFVIADEEVVPTDTDMQTVASRIAFKQPDAVVLYLLPPQLALFSKAMRNQGFKGKFFGGIQALNFQQVIASEKALIGTIFPAPAINELKSKFDEDYAEKFREPLTSQQELYGYDIATTLIEASRKSNIQDYLQSLKEISGVAGTYPRRENNFFEVPATLKRISSESTVEILKSH